MKNLFLAIALVAFIFSSCGHSRKKTHEVKEGYHTHSDGTVHKDSDHGHSTDEVKQESFTVEGEKESKEEHKGHGHDHDHSH